MMKLTLIDREMAKAGYEFVNYGDTEECRDCKLINTCIGNLEKGRKYRIINTRDAEHDCKITGRALVVEVEECDVFGALDQRKAFVGSKIVFVPVSCDNIFCNNMKYCKPEGLTNGDACKILDAAGKIDCEGGKDLVLVKLKRL
jgi:hypothetical protein